MLMMMMNWFVNCQLIGGRYEAARLIVDIRTVPRRRAHQVLDETQVVCRLLPVVRRSTRQRRAVHRTVSRFQIIPTQARTHGRHQDAHVCVDLHENIVYRVDQKSVITV